MQGEDSLSKLTNYFKSKLGITNIESNLQELNEKIKDIEIKIEVIKQIVEKIRYVEDEEFKSIYLALKREKIL